LRLEFPAKYFSPLLVIEKLDSPFAYLIPDHKPAITCTRTYEYSTLWGFDMLVDAAHAHKFLDPKFPGYPQQLGI
jgi:hypothetical protein